MENERNGIIERKVSVFVGWGGWGEGRGSGGY